MEQMQTTQHTQSDSLSWNGADTEITIDLMELMYRLLAKWKLALVILPLFVLTAGIYTFLLATPMYEATSTIYVLSRKDSAINMSDLQIGAALTQDYIKVFGMWEVHEEVITNLELPYSYSQMANMLSVENESGTRMLDISITSQNPAEASAIANEYAKVASQYIADTMATDKPNIMSVALTPVNPISPNRPFHLAIGFLAGLVLYCVIVFVEMLVDDKYKNPEDIRRYTGMATLAIVPLDDSDAHSKDKANRRRHK